MSAPIPYPNPPQKSTNIGRHLAKQIEAGNANSVGSGVGYRLQKGSHGTIVTTNAADDKLPMWHRDVWNADYEYHPNDVIHLTSSITFSYYDFDTDSTKTGTTPMGSYVCVQYVPMSHSVANAALIAQYSPNVVRYSNITYYPIYPEPTSTGSAPLGYQGKYWKLLGGGSVAQARWG